MRIIHIIAASFVLIAAPALAKEGSPAWIVAQKSGDVRVVHNGMQPASVQLRAALSPGDIIATGANGRAMLTRGDDYVVVSPGSRLMLPKEQQKGGFTQLLQQVGTMFYKVKHTGVPHFAVQTPMLAAVVKGTSFSVVVDKDRAAVQVTEGVVEVSSLSGDTRRLVERGLTVYIGRERPNEIIEMKPGVSVPATSPEGKAEAVKVERSGDVSLATVVNLTDGLVREGPVVVASNEATKVLAPVSSALAPAADNVKPVVNGVVAPVAEAVGGTVPAVVEPVTGVVQTTVPAVLAPVVDVVQTTVPGVVAPVVEVVQTAVPAVVAPVVEIVQTAVPAVVTPVVTPVVEIVQTTVPAVVAPVVAPVVDIVQTTVPAVVAPVLDVVQTVVPAITQPVSGLLGGLLGGGGH